MTSQQNHRAQLSGNSIKTVLLVCFCLLFSNLALSKTVQKNQFTVLEQLLRKMPAFCADFTQVTTSLLQSEKQMSQGHVTYSQPSYMKWQYTKPSPLTLVIGEKTIWLADLSLKNVTLYNKKQVFQGQQFAFLQRNFNLRTLYQPIKPKTNFLKTEKNQINLYFKPKKTTVLFNEIQIRFSLKKKKIYEIVLIDKNDMYKHFTFFNFAVIKKLNVKNFTFTPSINMDIINAR